MGKDDSPRDDRERGAIYAENAGERSSPLVYQEQIGELALQESFIIYRRRLGLSQSQMATLFNIHRETYGRLERGEQVQISTDRPALGGLQCHEKCFILRRRSGWTQEECADLMGITRYWFNLMELGKAPVEPLINFWGQNAR